MISKRHLSRRTLLRGAGAAIGLPLLDAMVPAFAGPTHPAARAKNRLAVVYVPNGIIMKYWTPEQNGSDFPLLRILEPVASFREDFLMLTGLDQNCGRALGDGPGDHARAAASYLTGVHPKKTAGADIRNGVSFDQIAARAVGNDCRFSSLELGCEQTGFVGNCDSGYSCAYSNNLSWRSETAPMPPAVNPRQVFERLFGAQEGPMDPASRARQRLYERSILDLAQEDTRRLQRELGPKPGPEALFKFCLPYERPTPTFRTSRIGDDEFAFVSESSDLRFLEAVPLRPDQLVGYQASGPVAGVVALVVGFGSNYLNVLSINGRLVLNNGNHRACSLWSAGIRRVPCVVQTITHPDEIDVHAPRAVKRNPDFYLTEPRPPLLGDYFDPVLGRKLNVALTRKQVRVSYSVDEKDMP
jgi:hypothetical protein